MQVETENIHPPKICFASDNWSAAHPDIMQAVARANEGYASPYGSDIWTEKAQNIVSNIFNRQCKILFVPTGTGANIFGLRCITRLKIES